MTSHDQQSTPSTPDLPSVDHHATPPATTSSLPSDSSPSRILLPIPTQSTNHSQPAFAFSHAFKDGPSLPAEVLNADISIARKFALVLNVPWRVVFRATLHSVDKQCHTLLGRGLINSLTFNLVFSRRKLRGNFLRVCCAGAQKKV